MAFWDQNNNNNDQQYGQPYEQPQPQPQEEQRDADGFTPEERAEYERMEKEDGNGGEQPAGDDTVQDDQPNDASESENAAEENGSDEDADGQSDGEPAEGETETESSEETPDGESEETESAEGDEHAESGKKSKRGGDKKPAKGKMPKIDQWNMQKLGDLWDSLKDPKNAAVAKLLLETGASSPAVLASLMTEPKVQRKAMATIARVKKLYVSGDEISTMMNLFEAFIEDNGFAKTLVGLLRAAAPDKGFVNASGSPKADAKNIAAKWDDSVDLSVLDSLRI